MNSGYWDFNAEIVYCIHARTHPFMALLQDCLDEPVPER